jgi:hypothetical protein
MKYYVTLCIFLFLGASALQGQGYVFGIKGGPSIGIQNWGNSFQRDPLFRYHGALFIESLPESNQWSLFAQAGYHPKGSAIRNRNFFDPVNGNFFRPPADVFIFHNASLILGAKQKFDVGTSSKWFYSFGIRGDYTVDTNLDRYDFFLEQNPNIAAVYPINAYFSENGFLGIRRLNYGFSGGAGLEWQFSKFIGASLEFTVNPDFSFQYTQPAIPNVRDPWTGESRTIPERKIRNLTFELTAAFRFLRKIEYID